MKKEIKQSEIDSLALTIMEEFAKENDAVTLEEAQEMARMELNEKQNRRYEKSDAPKKKVVRERKIDKEKAFLFNLLYNGFLSFDEVEINPTEKKESEFSFTYGENSYTVKLIKHRPQK